MSAQTALTLIILATFLGAFGSGFGIGYVLGQRSRE